MAGKANGSPQKRANKSRAIVKYHKSHPDAKPREIVAALKRRGLDVNAQYVSTILFNYRKRAEAGNEPVDEAAGESRKTVRLNATGVSAREIMLAKQLVKQSGSIGAARKALEMYGDIIA
jgi:hypothetical protein